MFISGYCIRNQASLFLIGAGIASVAKCQTTRKTHRKDAHTIVPINAQGGAKSDARLHLVAMFLSLCRPQIAQAPRSPVPSGGRVEVLCRGAFGMDANRGTMGQGWPTVTTLGTAPERGKLSAAKPVCRARFLFGYFLFARAKRK